MATFFDEVDKALTYPETMKPIWAMDLDDPNNEKKILEWLNAEAQYLQDQNEERHRAIQRNYSLYKGIQYLDQDRADIRQRGRERGQDRTQPVRKIVANHISDLVQNRASRLIKYKPAVAILPTNDEFGDKVSAKSVEQLLSHIWYVNQFEGKVTVDWVKQCMVAGEAYCFITWDPDKGDLHPDYEKEKKQHGDKVPLVGGDGKQETDESGNPVYVDRPIKVGDVVIETELSTNVLLQKKKKWEDVQYLFRIRVKNTEEVRLMYPKKASKIKEDAIQYYDYESMQLNESKNEVIVYEFYHKPIFGCDKGRLIVFTKDVILSNKEYPYDHENLPCVRLTDIDLPGELHGVSGINNVKALTSTYNNLLNLIVRNQILVSHPKWMMPAGAAKKESLGNDITIVEYKGPQAPVLVQANPTPPETFNFMSGLKQDFQQIYGAFGVSRGEPPKGITAGIALQWLSEQESERFNEMVLKYNEAIRMCALMTISVAGTYYDATDERMIRVLGKNSSWMSVFFDTAHLSKDYDVRMQNASALPQSKSARIQTIIDLAQNFPGVVSNEQVIDILDLAQDQKFTTAATVNVRAAEAENEQLLSVEEKKQNIPEPDPDEWDDHITHWKIHTKQMQEWSFKYQTPQAQKDKMKYHVAAHEMLMAKFALKNPMYAQQLMALPGFPLFYVAKPDFGQELPPPGGAIQAGPPMAAPPKPRVPEQQLPNNVPPPPVELQSQTESAVPAEIRNTEQTSAI